MIAVNDPHLTAELIEFAERNHYTHVRRMDDGRVAFLMLTITAAQVCIAEGTSAADGVTDRYIYADVPTAVRAYDAWIQRECSAEPEGWVRHQPSNRRRKYVGPDRDMIEYVAP